MAQANGSSRDLILTIAVEMNKTPAQMERFITVLEDNFLDTVESIRDLSDDQYKSMGFPIGLVNKIKKHISVEPAQQPAGAATNAATGNTQMISTNQEAERPQVSPLSTSERAVICLDNLQESEVRCSDPQEKKAMVKGVVTTLFKIISNILTSPFEPKFRKLPRHAKSVQEKILAYPSAMNFLKIAGFKFDEPGDHIVIVAYSKEELESCLNALKLFVERLGGQINDPKAFNPYKAGVSSTTGQVAVPRDATNTGHTKINKAQQEIENIEKAREAELEDHVEDREIQIYNQKASTSSQSMNTNQFLAMMEKRQVDEAVAKSQAAEEEKKGDAEMADETGQAAAGTSMIDTAAPTGVVIGSNHQSILDGTVADITDEDERRGALQFIADQLKKEKFRDRLAIQLDAVKKRAHHTRTKIRVKMPDGYIISGTFGAKEKVKDVMAFMKDCIVLKERNFYLFEVPPKRVLTNMNQSLQQAKLVPSCLLYFGWSDQDETKIGDGPFLDMVGLREYIVQL